MVILSRLVAVYQGRSLFNLDFVLESEQELFVLLRIDSCKEVFNVAEELEVVGVLSERLEAAVEVVEGLAVVGQV